MVERCSYLPLVISSLGGVLSKRKSVEEWESVKKNVNACLHRAKGIDGEEEVHEVLRLSYDDLPYYLKPCFLYMGLFLQGEVITVNVLYRRWIAQGMISHGNQENDETLMDIAELYLSELALRCIVQVEVHEVIQGQVYSTCKLHHVIRDLCLSLGRKEEFGLKIFYYENGRFSTSLHECLLVTKTRHLVIIFRAELELELDHGDFPISHDIIRYVRSLTFSNMVVGKRIEFPHAILDLQKFKFLQELIFINFIFPERKLPNEIGNLILLRYLFVRGCELDELPSSISNLVFLCTLDLFNSWNIQVPDVLKKMCRLKHLLLPPYELEIIGDYFLRLEGLDELETLSGFDSKVHDFKSISRMRKLRRFGAVVRDNESLSAIIDAITGNWEYLQHSELTITKDCQFTSEEALINLKKVLACSSLHLLKIFARIGNLLEECIIQTVTSNLKQLTLYNSEIENDAMKIFGTLPFLQKLRLLDSSFTGNQVKCLASGFPRLKLLTLAGLPNLSAWEVERGAMPLLSEIRIFSCPLLQMVPDGFRFLPALQTLIIVGMPELGNRLSELQDDGGEGEDFDKVRHVPSVLIFTD